MQSPSIHIPFRVKTQMRHWTLSMVWKSFAC